MLASTFWLGETCAWRGEFDQASQLYRQVLAEAVGGEEMLDDQAAARMGLAQIAYEQDDLDTAEQYAAQARDLSQQRSNEEELVHASVLLARIQLARAQTAQAQAALRALVGRTQRPELLHEVQRWQVRLALISGDVEMARHWTAANSQRRDMPDLQQEQAALLLARVHLIDQSSGAALKLLQPWRVAARQHGRVRSELEILCVQAMTYASQADTPRAYKVLTQALMLAQPKGYRRLFLEKT